jgi:hypothetical protein
MEQSNKLIRVPQPRISQDGKAATKNTSTTDFTDFTDKKNSFPIREIREIRGKTPLWRGRAPCSILSCSNVRWRKI